MTEQLFRLSEDADPVTGPMLLAAVRSAFQAARASACRQLGIAVGEEFALFPDVDPRAAFATATCVRDDGRCVTAAARVIFSDGPLH